MKPISHFFARKIAIAAALAATLAATGCATKQGSSEVLVAPIGVPGAQHGNYNGGSLVNNSGNIQNAASQMQNVVYFGFDLSTITPEAARILDAHAAFLKQNPSAKVLVAGNTDERGSREYNVALGERRAAAVRAYLAAHGADTNNIEIISYGEERPAVEGSNEAAWAKNRRAELNY